MNDVACFASHPSSVIQVDTPGGLRLDSGDFHSNLTPKASRKTVVEIVGVGLVFGGSPHSKRQEEKVTMT